MHVMARPKILITGAAGYVGQLLLPSLRRHYQLRCLDITPQRATGDDEILLADINDLDAMLNACQDVTAVVHLAAKGFEDDFLTVLLPRNVTGTWSVFRAAVHAGVPKVVFASTGQAISGNPADTFVTAELPARPISEYACTKLFGEALGRFHADTHGLQVACLRLGWVVPPDSPLFSTEPTLPSTWCSPNDLSRLIQAALESDVHFATVIAVSPSATGRFDTSNPYGWVPVDKIDV